MAHLRLRSGATLLAGVADAINRGVSFGSVCSLLKTQGVAALADPATGELHARDSEDSEDEHQRRRRRRLEDEDADADAAFLILQQGGEARGG
ncbi:hypothetical protein V8C86DRAFT_3121811 [Haematococcus lacustris]